VNGQNVSFYAGGGKKRGADIQDGKQCSASGDVRYPENGD